MTLYLTPEQVLETLLSAPHGRTKDAPDDSRGIYGLVDHHGDLRYIGSTSSASETLRKGAEFRAVAIPFLDQDVLPDEKRLLAARDEGQLDEVMNTERHLLYVAATRARDFLWMSGTEPLSDFLSDLIQARKSE